jgi:hypothetical protein
VLLKEGQQVTFTFAVNWLPTATPFGQRFERYLDYNFFEHKVRAGTHTFDFVSPGGAAHS